METLKPISQWFKKLCERHRAKRRLKRERFLDNLSCESINITEFDGRLYITYRDVPVVRVDDVKIDPVKLVAQARKDYLAWKAKFNV